MPVKPHAAPSLPPLSERLAAEFRAHTLALLAFPVRQDSQVLDAVAWRFTRPEPPRDLDLPLLPEKRYPFIARDDQDAMLALLVPPAPVPTFTGRRAEFEQIVSALLNERAVNISGPPGVGKTALLRQIQTDPRIRKRFRHIWWVENARNLGDAIGLALAAPPLLHLEGEKQAQAIATALQDAKILLLIDQVPDDSVLRYGPHIAFTSEANFSGAVQVRLGTLDREVAQTLSGLNDAPLLDALSGSPVALMLARSLAENDNLSVDDLRGLVGETGPEALIQASWAALPAHYQALALALDRNRPQAAPIAALEAWAGDKIGLRRALKFLSGYGWAEVAGDSVRAGWCPIPAGVPDAHELDLQIEQPRPIHQTFRERSQEAPTGPRAQAAALHKRGIDALEENRDPDAETSLTEALALRREHDQPHAIAETLVALARLAYLRGDETTSIALLSEAGELLDRLRDDESLDIVRLALSRAYRRAGRLEIAQTALPADPPYEDQFALALLAERWSDALQAAERAEDPKLKRRLTARVYLHTGRYADALEAIRSDDDFHARHIRAQVYHLQGDFARAVKAYEKADELTILDMERGGFARGRAKALAALGQYQDAARIAGAEGVWYEAKIARPIFARQAASHALYGALMLAQSEFDEAQTGAARALSVPGEQIAPETLATAQHTLARCMAQRDESGAIAAYQAALNAREQTQPRDEASISLTLHALGEALMRRSEPDRAVSQFRRALPGLNEEQRVITLLALRDALNRTDRASEALDAGQQAIALLKEVPARLPALGYVLALQSRAFEEGGRLTRAAQMFADWQAALIALDDPLEHPRWEIQLLWLGLSLRGGGDKHYSPKLLNDFAEEALAVAEAHIPDTWAAWAARRDVGERQLAQHAYETALEIYRPLTLVDEPEANLTIRLPAYVAMGDALLALGRPGEACVYFEAAAPMEPDPTPRGRLLRSLGKAYADAGNPERAAATYSDALAYLTREAAPDDHVGTLVDLGYARLGLNEFSGAIETFEEALGIVQNLPDPKLMSAVLMDLAAAHATLGQHRRAAATWRRALPLLKDPARIAEANLGIARSSAAQGMYVQALDAFNEAIQTPGATFTDMQRRAIRVEQASAYAGLNKLPEAINSYTVALAIEGSTKAEAAAIRRSLGAIYTRQGDHEKARENFQQALVEVEDADTGLTLLAIAEGHHAQGQIVVALETYSKALANLDRATYPSERAATLRTMGELFLAQGRTVESISMFEGALEIEKAQPRQDGGRIVAIIQGIATAYEQRGEPDKAVARHHQALVYQDARHAPELYANTLRRLGRLYIQMRRYDDAGKALEDALGTEYAQPTPDANAITETTKLLADVYRSQNRLDEAAALYRQVNESGSETSAGDEASQALASTLGDITRHEETLRAAEQSWKLLNRSANADLKSLLFVVALQAQTYAAMGRTAESRDYLDRMAALLDQRRGEVATDARDPALRALAFLLEGQEAEATGAFERAIPAYREGLRIAEESRLTPALIWALRQKIGKR